MPWGAGYKASGHSQQQRSQLPVSAAIRFLMVFYACSITVGKCRFFFFFSPPPDPLRSLLRNNEIWSLFGFDACCALTHNQAIHHCLGNVVWTELQQGLIATSRLAEERRCTSCMAFGEQQYPKCLSVNIYSMTGLTRLVLFTQDSVLVHDNALSVLIGSPWPIICPLCTKMKTFFKIIFQKIMLGIMI